MELFELENDCLENLLYLFMLQYPATNGERIYSYWYKHAILQIYQRPEKEKVAHIIQQVKSEIRDLLITC